MAITIDWATKVITIPKADTSLVSAGPPEIRSLDVDAFHESLRDLEDDEVGIVFDVTHNYRGTATLSGVVYAPLVEIINGYTVTFENGAYAVDLDGANNNITDVVNLNTVSLRSKNSAGLQIVSVGSGLSASEQAKLDELWKVAGLDSANPAVFTPSGIDAGAGVDINITGDGTTTSTLTRQP